MQGAYEIRTYRLKKVSNMAKKLYDAVIPTGEYVDKNGNNKTRWEVIGSVLELDGGTKGLLLKRTFAPSGMPVDDKAPNNVFINLFEHKRDNGGYTAW